MGFLSDNRATVKSRVLTRLILKHMQASCFRLLMKGVFDAYVPFGEKFIFELLTRVRTRDFTVLTLCCKNILRSIYNCALSETQPKRSDFEKTKL